MAILPCWGVGRFLVSWFLGFLFSWFLRSKVSKRQSFKTDSMFDDRCGSHTTTFPILCFLKEIAPLLNICKTNSYFWKILTSDSRCSRIIKTDLHWFTAPVFPNKNRNYRCQFYIFGKQYVRIWFGSFLGLFGVSLSPEIKIVGFGSHGYVQKSRNHRNEGFTVSSTMKLRSY